MRPRFVIKVSDLFEMDALAKHVAERTVNVQAHPESRLRIANYTQRAQFSSAWDEVTMQCRGLIFDAETLEVVARPWRKFWNLGDARWPETLPENLPAAPPILTRKLDGSLGIGYPLNGGLRVATRGSFISEQAGWATRWMAENHPGLAIPAGWTALWEIVYEENRIVVRYEWEGLVCLGLVKIDTGEEMSLEEARGWAAEQGVRYVESFDKPLAGLADEDSENEEGYVATWLRAGAPPLKVKIKYGTYVKIHKILTGTSIVGVWELLRDGKDLASLKSGMPEEFVAWLAGLEARLVGEYRELEGRALEAFRAYPGRVEDAKNPEQRKEFAAYAVGQKGLTPLLFTLLDGGDIAPMVWKMIRPRGDEGTFKKDEE
jgi:RNA ligase